MAQTGNEILKQILGVCVQINKKMDKKEGSSGEGSSDGLGSIFGKGKAKTAAAGKKVLDGIFNSISSFMKLKQSDKKIKKTATALDLLFKTIVYMGDHRKQGNAAISLLTRLHIGMKGMEKTAKALSILLLSLGGAVVLLAGGVMLAGKLLGTVGAVATMGAVLLIMATIVGSIWLLSKIDKDVKQGAKAASGMGIAFGFLAGGIVLFAMGIATVGKILGAAGPEGIITGALGVIGILGAMTMAFYAIGKFEKQIGAGALAAAFIGLGLTAVAWGVGNLAKAASALTNIGGPTTATKGGKQKGKFGQMMSDIGPGLGAIGIIFLSAALLFAGLGAIMIGSAGIGAGILLAGIGAAIAIAGGVSAMAKATINVSKAIKQVDDIDNLETNISTMVSALIGGLVTGYRDGLGGSGSGLKAIVNTVKNTAALFTAIITLKRLAKGLSKFAKAISAFAELETMRDIKGYDKEGNPIFGERINTKNVADNIAYSVTTFLSTMISVGQLDASQKKGLRRLSRVLTGRRGMLRAITDFSDVIKVWANFGDGTAIPYGYTVDTGATDEDGNPITKTISGSVSLTTVVGNIVTAFSQFVTDFTGKMADFEMTGRQGRQMKRLSRVLSGRNGLLTPITEFADVLKLYSQFGKEGKIAYSTFEGDSDKPVIKSVLLTEIVTNIVDSFGAFVDDISSRGFGISKRKKRQLKRLSKALNGSGGLMEPISKFGEVLLTFSKFGKNGEMPVLDAEGKPTGEVVSMTEIATNIFTGINAFVTQMTGGDIKMSKRDKARINDNLNMVKGVIKKFSDIKITEDFDKTAKTIFSIVKTINTEASANSIELSRKDKNRIKDNLSMAKFIVDKFGELKISKGIDATAKSILGMSESIRELSKALSELDPTALASINKLGTRRANALISMKGEGIGDAARNLIPKMKEAAEKREDKREERKEQRVAKTTTQPEKSSDKKGKEYDPKEQMDMMRKMQEEMMQQQASTISAALVGVFKNGQFTFDFQGDNKGILNFG